MNNYIKGFFLKSPSLKKPRIKLFWKILVLFWLISVIIFTFNLFFTHLNSDTIRYRKLPPHLTHQLKNTKYRLNKILNRKRHKIMKGSPALKKRMGSIYLVNKDGHDYFGKDISDVLYLLDKKVKNKQTSLTAFRKQVLYFGGTVIKFNDEKYRIYIFQKFSILSRGYFSVFIREFSHNLLMTTLLISFPLSLFLAWIFTRPIKKLQTAVKELSSNLQNKKSLEGLIERTDEFGDLAKDFYSMTIHLNEVMESKTRLLGDVSHELKSPLARMQIALALADKKQNKSNTDLPELKRIKLEADRMNEMISGLLDYAKIDTLTSSEQNTFNLPKLIELLVDDANFESQQRNIIIKTELDNELIMSASKSMMISCIENILRNAIQYANNEILISCKNEIFDNSSLNNIAITITDDGIGVEENQLIKIFDTFYRPELDRSRQSGGSGLGLSIAKKVVEYHQGKITAENVKPHGLKVTIAIPNELNHYRVITNKHS